jgi:trimeric autotransporter adhesin
MATSTFTTNSHALNVYSANDLTYLKISQDGTVSTRMNFDVKNTSDGSENSTIKPYFRSLTFKEGASTTTLSTRFAALDTSIATNAANIATNTTNISSNGTNIATNSTAISTEAGARAAGDASLQAQINAANVSAGAEIETLTTDLTTEINDRLAADQTLTNSIVAETTNRIAGDTAAATALADAIILAMVDVDTNTAAIATLQTNVNGILNLSTEQLNSFAEVATAFDNIGLATINTRLANLEAAVAALQNP